MKAFLKYSGTWFLLTALLCTAAPASAHPCNEKFHTLVPSDATAHTYMTGLLARASDGSVTFAVGSVTDAHYMLRDAISSQHGGVTEVLWAGELEADSSGFIIANTTAGIIKKFPLLSKNARVENLRRFVEGDAEAKKWFSPAISFRTYELHPEHLHPRLQDLSDLRHELGNYSNGPSMIFNMFDDNEIEPDEVETFRNMLKKGALGIEKIVDAMIELQAPVPGLLRFKEINLKLKTEGDLTPEERNIFFNFLKIDLRKPSVALTLISSKK